MTTATRRRLIVSVIGVACPTLNPVPQRDEAKLKVYGFGGNAAGIADELNRVLAHEVAGGLVSVATDGRAALVTILD